jgi:DNA-3-methyladenine glycosylase
VVTGERDAGIAVLLRAAEIVEGEELVRVRRSGAIPLSRLLAGPGNLSRGLAVDLDLDAGPLDRGALRLEAGDRQGEPAILTGPRVGCESAGDAASWPLRYALAGSLAVSTPRPRAPYLP